MRLRMNRFPVWLALMLFLIRPHYLWAVQLDDLDPDKDWRLQRLTIAGNMVVPLIADGNIAAALALERQWNRLTHDLPFLTLCGYSASCFHDLVPDVWSQVCDEHWAVSHASDV